MSATIERIDADLSASFAEFFAARSKSAVRAAYLLTFSSEAAEDIAQDAFAQMYRRWSEIEQPDAYLWRTLTSVARSWGRKHRRTRRIDIVDTTEFDSDSLAVRQVLLTLPARQREALVLRFYLGFREREIAEAMHQAPGTVKSQIHRGLAAMKEALQ